MDDWKPSYLGEPRPVPPKQHPHPDRANDPARSVTRAAHSARGGAPGLITQQANEMRARQPDYGEGLSVSTGKLAALRRPGERGMNLGMFM